MNPFCILPTAVYHYPMVANNDFDCFVVFCCQWWISCQLSCLKCKAKRIVRKLLITNFGKVSFCHTCNVKAANHPPPPPYPERHIDVKRGTLSMDVPPNRKTIDTFLSETVLFDDKDQKLYINKGGKQRRKTEERSSGGKQSDEID